MDSIIAIELGILIVMAVIVSAKIGDLITASERIERIVPHITGLEQTLNRIERTVDDMKPRYDTNPDPYPDFPRD